MAASNNCNFFCQISHCNLIVYLYSASGRVHSDQLCPSCATLYVKTHCYDQLLINTACVSNGSPHLKRLWSSSVDFQIFCEFFNLTLTFPCDAISQKLLLQSTSN